MDPRTAHPAVPNPASRCGAVHSMHACSTNTARRVVESVVTPPLRCDRAWPLRRNAVELATWPLFHNALKSMTYMALIIAVAELIARARNIAPRDVPRAITASVVAGGLAVILGDWAFSQLLLLREGELV